MTKLEKLYAIIQNSQELGVNLGEDVLRQTNELEEKIIRDEILPIIGKNIEPTLRQIKRKLILVVDYDPEATQPLSVRMTRKRVITDEKETKEYPLIPLTKPATVEEPKHQSTHVVVNGRTGLRVTFSDGKVIHEKKALETLIATLEAFGLDSVEALNISCDHANLVSRELINNGSTFEWHKAGDWYVNTHSSTAQKARLLERIADKLNTKVKVEIIK